METKTNIPRLILAPMAGVTDLAFRVICHELGAEITVTEMVSSKALCYQDKKSLGLMKLAPCETKGGVQLFGSDPGCMAQAAAKVEALVHPAFIDINMGCPVPKVANSGDGSALMKDPEKAGRIVEAVKGAVSVPVTVKTRIGWDRGSINAVEMAKTVEAAGASAVAIHGRTRAMMYSGRADWTVIRDVKAAVGIPVAANGDIFSGHDAVRAARITGADYVMIGRGCFGNPWLFQQAAAALRGEEEPPIPPLSQRCDTFLRQFALALEDKGEKIACLEARKQYAWYLKGVPYASCWKERICRIETAEDVYRITEGIKNDLCGARRNYERENLV